MPRTRISGNCVFVSVKLALDVTRHRNVEGPFLIIPFELDPAVQVARPVLNEFILVADAFYEMVGMFFAHIFYAEIVNNKQESDWPPFVSPQSWRIGAFVITVGGKSFLQEFVG